MKQVIISKMLEGEEILIEVFIKEIFDEFIASDYSEKGVTSFYEFIDSNNIIKRCESGTNGLKHIIYTAKIDKQIVGVIETRDDTHICLFFVKNNYHGQGIGRKMFEHAFAGSTLDITVNSSPYAVKIYETMGFAKVNGEMVRHGIIYIPMIKQGI